MSLFLTRDEVSELTGYRIRRKVIEQLVRQGVQFYIAGDGWPRVPRSQIDNTAPAKEAALNIEAVK